MALAEALRRPHYPDLQQAALPTMSLMSRLIARVTDAIGLSEEGATTPDKLIAVAALLVHVARVDGLVRTAERHRMTALLAGRFGLSAEEAARLLARGDAFDRQTDDIAGLVEMMGHALPLAERRELVAMAYGVATADGGLGEFEDDLIWRTGRLLALGDDDIAACRRDAVPSALPEGVA